MLRIDVDLIDAYSPESPEYGDLWDNCDTREMWAYDSNGKWVTYEETDDSVLKDLLRKFI